MTIARRARERTRTDDDDARAGYSRFATAIERTIHLRFPSARVECEPTTHASGALEITVRGVLVHSKLNGDGYVDGPEKIERVCVTRNRRDAGSTRRDATEREKYSHSLTDVFRRDVG